MTGKVLICYSFKKIEPGKRKQFDRKMFGSVEKTHKGKYQTVVKGVLTNINYRKPVRSVIIISKKNLKKVLKIFQEFSAQTEVYKILNI